MENLASKYETIRSFLDIHLATEEANCASYFFFLLACRQEEQIEIVWEMSVFEVTQQFDRCVRAKKEEEETNIARSNRA